MWSAAFFSPEAESVLNHLIGHFLVALAENHIDRRLAADELREGRDHDRIAELGAHLRGFLQHLIELFFLAHELQLMPEVGNHPARHLMAVPGLIVFARRADR